MKLKALKTYELNGVVLKPGSEFEAPEHTAKQLIALKQAEVLTDNQVGSSDSEPSTPKRTRSQPKE
ncbi:DUF7210 family protein [Acinetobacter bereziniae]|uniref:DUF7210 family protein n=1 Tax=Acinetobacter bereziniae TaxID=106648 RepID=UPI0015DACD3B|nr:hypothetical protein [Acinetobacter bereziniae]